MEAYLEEGTEPSEEVLKKCIRAGTLANAIVPVLNGTAFKNKGVQPLLDAVVDFMPAPTDVAAIKGVGALIVRECVIASTSIKSVITEVAGEVVIAVTAIDGVRTSLTINGVVTTEARDRVVAIPTNKLVSLVGAFDREVFSYRAIGIKTWT